MLNRRGFLKRTGGLSAGLASWGPLAFLATARPGHADELSPFSKAKFESMLGSFMHLDMGEGAGWESVELVDVTEFPSSPYVEQFAIRLRTDPQVALEDGIYTVDTGLESFDLHLEPSEGDESAGYAAGTFSLLTDTTPVPEPGLWAMLIAGVGLLALKARGESEKASKPALD